MMNRGPRRAKAEASTDPKEMEAMARRAWQEHGIVIIWPERIKDEWDRQHVLNIASALYGKR